MTPESLTTDELAARLKALESALHDVKAIQDEYDGKPNLIPVAGWEAIRERLTHGDLDHDA